MTIERIEKRNVFFGLGTCLFLFPCVRPYPLFFSAVGRRLLFNFLSIHCPGEPSALIVLPSPVLFFGHAAACATVYLILGLGMS